MRGAVVPPPKKHHRHLSESELAAFWRELNKQQRASIIVVYAAKLLVYTMARKVELRLAKWHEFDLKAGIWNIPLIA